MAYATLYATDSKGSNNGKTATGSKIVPKED